MDNGIRYTIHAKKNTIGEAFPAIEGRNVVRFKVGRYNQSSISIFKGGGFPVVFSLAAQQDEMDQRHQRIEQSMEILTEDFMFLFERLNVCVAIAAIFSENQNSASFRQLLRETCRDLPLLLHEHILPQDAPPDQIITLIKSLNLNKSINGIIVDLPSPANYVFNHIDPQKDVRLNHADQVKLKEWSLAPEEEHLLGILMMLEKTFDITVEQLSRRRGNPL